MTLGGVVYDELYGVVQVLLFTWQRELSAEARGAAGASARISAMGNKDGSCIDVVEDIRNVEREQCVRLCAQNGDLERLAHGGRRRGGKQRLALTCESRVELGIRDWRAGISRQWVAHPATRALAGCTGRRKRGKGICIRARFGRRAWGRSEREDLTKFTYSPQHLVHATPSSFF